MDGVLPFHHKAGRTDPMELTPALGIVEEERVPAKVSGEAPVKGQ
jgi:hypothetical protein